VTHKTQLGNPGFWNVMPCYSVNGYKHFKVLWNFGIELPSKQVLHHRKMDSLTTSLQNLRMCRSTWQSKQKHCFITATITITFTVSDILQIMQWPRGIYHTKIVKIHVGTMKKLKWSSRCKCSRTPLIQINSDGKPSRYAERPENWIFLWK
jgi:hypothetical protein